MPHTPLSKRELDHQYPSLEAVEDINLEDLARLEDEQLYGVGMVVVRAIFREIAVTGRTRKPTPSNQAQAEPAQPPSE